MQKLSWIIALLMMAIARSGQAASPVIFLKDDFTATTLDSSKWHIPTWRYNGDGTYVGRTQFRCTQNIAPPKPMNGAAIIPLDTYNPTGFSFYGTDLITNQTFVVGHGLDIIVRAKMNTTVAGMVGGIFIYGVNPANSSLHDEIDFEFLTKEPAKLQTNIYGNESLGVGHPQFASYATGTITDYHIYEIKWLPGRVSWYVDGVQIRTETTHVPAGTVNFHLNMWGPDSGWSEAYSAALQPVSSASNNTTFSMSVDQVLIQSIPQTAVEESWMYYQ